MAKDLKIQIAFCCLLIIVMLLGCHFNNMEKEGAPKMTSVENALTETDFSHIDSVEWIYIDTTNSQKEMEGFFIKDTAFIAALQSNLSLPSIKTEECTHTVKGYLYKNGEVYKTLYVAFGDTCNYVAYAVNGQPVFVPLVASLKRYIDSMVKAGNN